ncbi:g4981 [Coccomyxa elongata]
MEACFPAQAPLAQPAAGHYLPPLGSLPASAPPAGRSAVCGRGDDSAPPTVRAPQVAGRTTEPPGREILRGELRGHVWWAARTGGGWPVPWGGRDTPSAVPGCALWIPRPVVPRDWSPIPRWRWKVADKAEAPSRNPLGQPSQERTRRLAAQTFFWRTTSGHGGPLPSSGPSGTACGWPLSTTSGQPTSERATRRTQRSLRARKALLGDWRLATVTIRQTEGVLSDWLRGRDPKLTREEFRERWCHRDILCVLGAEPDAQLLNHWSAHHPVPLPA